MFDAKRTDPGENARNWSVSASLDGGSGLPASSPQGAAEAPLVPPADLPPAGADDLPLALATDELARRLRAVGVTDDDLDAARLAWPDFTDEATPEREETNHAA
jgi:hypothetical protein